MENKPNENQPMEYELVGAISEGKEIEDRDEPVENKLLEGELVEYKPVRTSQKINNSVYITFIDLEHNHAINVDNTRFATAFQKFDEPIISEI
ncbi:26412_t:CDS:2, partial [Gigaspora margarita]